jgi:adenosylcobinamide kinase/adenosylcobinamide-phosphate guanylyltransferase
VTRVLVTGGARSGKSVFAEGRWGERSVLYVAPGAPPDPSDHEWADRIALHRERRPATWITLETTDLAAALRTTETPDAMLIDCLGTWLAGAMDDAGIWAEAEGTDGSERRRAADGRLQGRIADLFAAWTSCAIDVVLVTNEVGSSVVPATASGRRFRDEIGRLNVAMASSADEVWLVTVGIPQRLR